MSARFFHFSFVALILTNPICCQMMGFGGGPDACCGVDPWDCCRDACRGTCEKSEGDVCSYPNEQAPADSPCDCPCGRICQCFPAGAICTEPTTFDIAQDELTPDCVDLTVALQQHDACPRRLRGHGRWHPNRANAGRIARIWHSSFLC